MVWDLDAVIPSWPWTEFSFYLFASVCFYVSLEVAVTVRHMPSATDQPGGCRVWAGPIASSSGLTGAMGLRSLDLYIPLVALTRCATLRQNLTQLLTSCTTHLLQFISHL